MHGAASPSRRCLRPMAGATKPLMTRMHNPPHPGAVLREYLGDLPVNQAADHLRVNRVTLSRVLNGASGISADMAIRLGQALGTSADVWAGMQLQYDLSIAEQQDRPKIERLPIAA